MPREKKSQPYLDYVSNLSELQALRDRSAQASEQALRKLSKLLLAKNPMEALKFELVGSDPCAPEKAMHLLEQINIHATYELAFDAMEELLRLHPGKEWKLAPGARADGSDIESTDGEVACEVFAAMKPDNNGKMKADLERLEQRAHVPHRYLFYRANEEGKVPKGPEWKGIRVIFLARSEDSAA